MEEDSKTHFYESLASQKDSKTRRRELNRLSQQESRRRRSENLAKLRNDNEALAKQVKSLEEALRKQQDGQQTAPQSNFSASGAGTSQEPEGRTFRGMMDDQQGDMYSGFLAADKLNVHLEDFSFERPFHALLGQRFPHERQKQGKAKYQEDSQSSSRSNNTPTTQEETLWIASLRGPSLTRTASVLVV